MLRLFRIHGSSLEPEYQSGDFVLVSKIPFYFHPPKAGDIIGFKHPAFGLLIKQIGAVNPNTRELSVIGTHPDSIDSREFGPILIKQIFGKVFWHIHPKR
jgi:signal peptidase I